MVEPMQDLIWAVISCQNSAALKSDDKLYAVSAIKFSNEMYGSDAVSSSKGYMKPIEQACFPQTALNKLISAHGEIQIKSKLTRILQSKATQESIITPGSVV